MRARASKGAAGERARRVHERRVPSRDRHGYPARGGRAAKLGAESRTLSIPQASGRSKSADQRASGSGRVLCCRRRVGVLGRHTAMLGSFPAVTSGADADGADDPDRREAFLRQLAYLAEGRVARACANGDCPTQQSLSNPVLSRDARGRDGRLNVHPPPPPHPTPPPLHLHGPARFYEPTVLADRRKIRSLFFPFFSARRAHVECDQTASRKSPGDGSSHACRRSLEKLRWVVQCGVTAVVVHARRHEGRGKSLSRRTARGGKRGRRFCGMPLRSGDNPTRRGASQLVAGTGALSLLASVKSLPLFLTSYHPHSHPSLPSISHSPYVVE